MDINITTGVLIFFSILRLAVAVPLFQTARKNNLTNLYWLSAQFICLVIAVPFAKIGAFDNRWIFWTFISLTEISLIMFIHTTFYQGRSSPVNIFLILAGIGMLGGVYGNATGNFEFSAWSVYPLVGLIWIWHFVEASTAYQNIERQKSTEGWIKSRYQLMITYSGLDFFSAILGTMTTTGLWNSDIVSLLVVLINMISVVTQIFTWVMPNWLKNIFNRNQKQAQDAQRDEHVHAMLDAIASAMTREGHLTKMMCLYAIRTAVGKMLKRVDSATVNEYLNGMHFAEWMQFIQDAEFHRILVNTAVDVDVKTAINFAQRALVEQQSLFIMSAEY